MAASPASIAAIILAAGKGARLGGRAKASLQIGGRSLLERLSTALRDAGVADVSVVIGPYREQLLPLAQGCGIRVVAHALADSSLVESQRLAIDSHLHHCAGADLLLTVADLPLLGAAHVRPLLEAWRQRPPAIHARMPVVDGVRGHPVVLSWHSVQQMAGMARHLGVRDWLAANPGLIQLLRASERAYVTDLDTHADLARVRAQLHPESVAWPLTAAGPVAGAPLIGATHCDDASTPAEDETMVRNFAAKASE